MPDETTGIEETRYQGRSKGRVETALEDLEQLHGSAKSRISAATFGAACLWEREPSPAHDRRRGRCCSPLAMSSHYCIAGGSVPQGRCYRRGDSLTCALSACTGNQEVTYAR